MGKERKKIAIFDTEYEKHEELHNRLRQAGYEVAVYPRYLQDTPRELGVSYGQVGLRNGLRPIASAECEFDLILMGDVFDYYPPRGNLSERFLLDIAYIEGDTSIKRTSILDIGTEEKPGWLAEAINLIGKTSRKGKYSDRWVQEIVHKVSTHFAVQDHYALGTQDFYKAYNLVKDFLSERGVPVIFGKS